MKKLKCSVLAALCFASLSTSGWGQTQADFITGTHEEFENYLLLNKSVDNTITHWEAEFYQQYYDTVSQTVKENLIRTVKTETLDGYLYVDPSLKNETDYLKIVVNGLNDAGQKIVYDDIIPPVPNNHISLIPLCENSCIGKTYAYTIRINERYQYGNLLPGHQVDVVAKTGYPYEYEYFSNTAFNNMMSN